MIRRDFTKAGVIALLMAAGVGWESAAVETGAGTREPNILLIMVDDLGCQGVKDFKIPNIDRLAASGVRFTAGYVTAPQCGPSRAGLLTGMHQSRFGWTTTQVEGLSAASAPVEREISRS